MDLSVPSKDEIWFLHVCYHISTGLNIKKVYKKCKFLYLPVLYLESVQARVTVTERVCGRWHNNVPAAQHCACCPEQQLYLEGLNLHPSHVHPHQLLLCLLVLQSIMAGYIYIKPKILFYIL